jgi:hypothetical protein
LTLLGVSSVSFGLALLRLLSARPVVNGCCANEGDRKEMQASSAKQRSRATVGPDRPHVVARDKCGASDRGFVCPDKNWRISLFLQKSIARLTPVRATLHIGDGTCQETNRYSSTIRIVNDQTEVYTPNLWNRKSIDQNDVRKRLHITLISAYFSTFSANVRFLVIER